MLFALTLTACSTATQPKSTTSLVTKAVSTQLVSQQNLENWKVNLIPRIENNLQVYDLVAEYNGNLPTQLVFSYRVNSKEKMSGQIIEPDGQIKISKLEPHEKVSFIGLRLPLNTPIAVGFLWNKEQPSFVTGDCVFNISESN